MDKEGKRGHLFYFTFNVFFIDNFSKEGKKGHLFNFTFTFNVFLCVGKVFMKVTATTMSSRDADMLSRFFLRNFLHFCEIHFLQQIFNERKDIAK